MMGSSVPDPDTMERSGATAAQWWESPRREAQLLPRGCHRPSNRTAWPLGNDANLHQTTGRAPTDTSRHSDRLDAAHHDRGSCPIFSMSGSVDLRTLLNNDGVACGSRPAVATPPQATLSQSTVNLRCHKFRDITSHYLSPSIHTIQLSMSPRFHSRRCRPQHSSSRKYLRLAHGNASERKEPCLAAGTVCGNCLLVTYRANSIPIDVPKLSRMCFLSRTRHCVDSPTPFIP